MRIIMLVSFLIFCLSSVFGQYDSPLTRKADTVQYELMDKFPGIRIIYPDMPASYPYGRDSLIRWLNQNLPAELYNRHPNDLYIVLQFKVQQDSTLSDFTFVNGKKGLFSNAVKMLQKSQPWIPATLNSKHVNSLVKLRVDFKQPSVLIAF